MSDLKLLSGVIVLSRYLFEPGVVSCLCCQCMMAEGLSLEEVKEKMEEVDKDYMAGNE